MIMVDVIFNILKFVLVIVSIIYFFKRFFISSIKKDIKDKNEYLHSLQQEKVSLFIHRQQVEKEIELQEETSKNLLLKANVWKKGFEEKVAAENKDYDMQKVVIIDKLKNQEYHYKLNKLRKKIITQVTTKLNLELEEYFADIEHQQNYNKKIINFFEKK